MFSRQVIMDIIDTLPNEYAPLERFLIRYNLDDKIDIEGLSTTKIKLTITKYLILNPDATDAFGNNVAHQIVEDRINNYLLDRYGFDEDLPGFVNYPTLYKYLRYDGYDVEGGKLIRTLPEDTDSSEKEDEISSLLEKYRFVTTKGHLDSAKSSFFNSNYPALTSQLRTYVESLFVEMAKVIRNREASNPDISKITPVNATTAMQVLAKCTNPIINQDLNEWDGGTRKTFIEGFWNRLHPMGSHPGLPDEDEALFRMQLVLMVTYNLIKRFDSLYM